MRRLPLLMSLLFIPVYFLNGWPAQARNEQLDLSQLTGNVAVMVGAFDPPHKGHQMIVEAALKSGNVDYVIVVPNSLALHKPEAGLFNDRVNMTRIAFAGNPKVLVASDSEPTRSSASIIYEQLDYLRASKGIKVYNLIGADVAASSSRRLINLLFTNRHVDGHLVNYYPHVEDREYQNLVKKIPRDIYGVQIIRLPMDIKENIHSTYIRPALAKGEVPTELDPKVARYALKHSIYTPEAIASRRLTVPARLKLAIRVLVGR